MGKQRFRLELEGIEAIIELDDAVIDAVDDDWREVFYRLNTPEAIAEHVGYNLIVNHVGLPLLDGWANQLSENARIVTEPRWEVKAERVEQDDATTTG